ncbi:hypothetical protein ACWCQM_18110 [Streptomyces sp. NPDC002125]
MAYGGHLAVETYIRITSAPREITAAFAALSPRAPGGTSGCSVTS